MKISYNWLKSYIPDAPEADKLADIITYHLAEVETVEKIGDDAILDIKILPNRAHDLLSHQGVAREIASLLNINFVDPTPKYKIPESKPTELIKRIESPTCRRYMGRIIRNIKVGPSPEWVVKHLESIGQRSINNIVDATNIVMFDCGQPAHVFDLHKVKSLTLKVRNAQNGEKVTLLGGAEKTLDDSMMVIADDAGNILDIAGIKGGAFAELDTDTKDIILECANFDPTSVRKTAQRLNIFTDARKRFENDLSPTLAPYAMMELSALIAEMCPEAIFEDIVDTYPQKQEAHTLKFSVNKISKILGVAVSGIEVGNILERYHIGYKNEGDEFEIQVPPMRLDLNIEEDMAEEIGRIMGYDKVKGALPQIDFKPKVNEVYAKTSWARNKLLNDGYHEVMTYVFCDKGEVEVMQSASDKKFLRTNLVDGIKESLKLNKTNAPLLGITDVKIFEIGTIFKKDHEEIHVCYGDKKEIKEMTLDEFTQSAKLFLNGLAGEGDPENRGPEKMTLPMKFTMWSLFPFIARDVAVWVPDGVGSTEVLDIIKSVPSELIVKGPELFDEFKKDGKTSYAFKLIFQSYERTLTDAEVNEVMSQITSKIESAGWQVR